MPIIITIYTPFAKINMIRVEILDAVVAGIRHIDIAIGRHFHSIGIKELSIAIALSSPLAQIYTVVREIRDAMIAGICDINPHGNRIYGYPLWIVELVVGGTEIAPFTQIYDHFG